MPDIFINQPVSPSVSSALPSHSHHFASFCEHPDGVHFEHQEKDEYILLFLRKHFITNVPWIFSVTLLLILPFIVNILLPATGFSPIIPAPNSFLLIFILFYYLVVTTYAFIQFITWYYTISIVTQKRIVDIDFSDVVFHDVAVTKLNLIEDTNYTQVGFIHTFFNFGDVFVQTAGEKLHFDFLSVPKPTRVVNIIQNLIGKAEHV